MKEEYEEKIVKLQEEYTTKNLQTEEAHAKEINDFTQKIKDNEIVIQELSILKAEVEVRENLEFCEMKRDIS